MDSKTTYYLAIDAGGSFLKSAILNLEGEVEEGSDFMTKSYSEGPREKILEAIRQTIIHGIRFLDLRGQKPAGIGIATPGPFDYSRGTPLMQHKFKAIYGVNLFCEIYGISWVGNDIPVQFMSDTNTVLAGEIWKGNAKGFDNAAVVTLGTGLGFAFSQNGIIQRNNMGGPQQVVFNIPYKNGILEDYASERGLLRIYREISGKSGTGNIKVSEIGQWAESGEFTSLQTFSEAGRILGESLRDIIRERNIRCLLFGGQISRSFCFLENALRNELREVKGLQEITTVKSIEYSALIGVLKTLIDG